MVSLSASWRSTEGINAKITYILGKKQVSRQRHMFTILKYQASWVGNNFLFSFCTTENCKIDINIRTVTLVSLHSHLLAFCTIKIKNNVITYFFVTKIFKTDIHIILLLILKLLLHFYLSGTLSPTPYCQMGQNSKLTSYIHFFQHQKPKNCYA